jgi:hypothetical protein
MMAFRNNPLKRPASKSRPIFGASLLKDRALIFNFLGRDMVFSYIVFFIWFVFRTASLENSIFKKNSKFCDKFFRWFLFFGVICFGRYISIYYYVFLYLNCRPHIRLPKKYFLGPSIFIHGTLLVWQKKSSILKGENEWMTIYLYLIIIKRQNFHHVFFYL